MLMSTKIIAWVLLSAQTGLLPHKALDATAKTGGLGQNPTLGGAGGWASPPEKHKHASISS